MLKKQKGVWKRMKEQLLSELEMAMLTNDKDTRDTLLAMLEKDHGVNKESAEIMAFNKNAGR